MNSWRIALVLVASLAACGGDPSRAYRQTLVSRERRVVTRSPALDTYFAAVYGHQQALGRADLRRSRAIAAFARAVDLNENAEETALVSAIQARLTQANVAHVRVRFTTAPNSAERLDAWAAALSTAPPAGHDMAADIEARFQEFVATIQVALTPDHPEANLGTLLADLTTILGQAEATRRCMERLTGATNPVFAGGAEVVRAAPAALRAEFASAERFVLSVPARATLQTQESVRTERWLLAAVSPDTEGDVPRQNDQSPDPLDSAASPQSATTAETPDRRSGSGASTPGTGTVTTSPSSSGTPSP